MNKDIRWEQLDAARIEIAELKRDKKKFVEFAQSCLEPSGAYSRDHAQHLENIIESIIERARDVLTIRDAQEVKE